MPLIRNFLPYTEARDFVRSMGFKNTREWDEYRKKDRRLNIPSNPPIVYKNQGWISWMDWLGTNNLRFGERKYTVNDNYFKKWKPNMAYIFGFWIADGNMGRSGLISRPLSRSYVFNITQNKKDKYLLEAMLREMDSNYPLSTNNNCYVFRINSKTIYDDIVRLGGEERKSLTVKFPNIPDKYLSDFIRGLWDGDGTIYYNKRSRCYVSTYYSGSRDFISGLYWALKKNIPNLGGSIFNGTDNDHRLQFKKNDTVRLREFIYQEPLDGKLMLKRKYDLFLKTPDYCLCEFLDFRSAQKIANSFNIKSCAEWRKKCKDGLIPHNVPLNPYGVYKNSGWVDWYVWLGMPRGKNKK